MKKRSLKRKMARKTRSSAWKIAFKAVRVLIGFELDRKKTGFGTNWLLAHALAGRRLPTSELKHKRVCPVVKMLLSKLVRPFN